LPPAAAGASSHSPAAQSSSGIALRVAPQPCGARRRKQHSSGSRSRKPGWSASRWPRPATPARFTSASCPRHQPSSLPQSAVSKTLRRFAGTLLPARLARPQHVTSPQKCRQTRGPGIRAGGIALRCRCRRLRKATAAPPTPTPTHRDLRSTVHRPCRPSGVCRGPGGWHHEQLLQAH
jgi:hypothetical protein